MNSLQANSIRSEPPSQTASQLRLIDALAEYHGAADSNCPIDREAFLERYADIRDELAGYLDSFDLIRTLAPDLGGATEPQSAAADGLPERATLGDFRIIREIGRGGMGVVYEAEQLSIGRRVALKVLPFAAMLDRQQLNRFKNEARAAGTLDHPNIVAIYFVGCERSVHFYAMQLIEGKSLAQVIEQLRAGSHPKGTRRGAGSEVSGVRRVESSIRCQVSECEVEDTAPVAHLSTLHAPGSQLPAFASREYFRTVAQLGIQAAEALDHAHRNGILHRDIKPANLLVDDTGKLWITDFGLARMEQDAGMTMTGDLLGTLRYMSPEQALAQRVVVDHRSDIYSLGVTLYEMITLRPAYAAADRHELLRQIAFEDSRKPRQINSLIPQDLETIVLKAIEKNPVQRYATAHGLADDLRSFLQSHPIKAKPPTWRDQVIKWSRRHPAGVRATLAVIVTTAIIVAAGMGWMSRDRAARHAALAEQVTLALDEAKTCYEAGKLTEAMSAVKRSEGLLASNRRNDEIAKLVGQWRTDLETVGRLQDIRLARATIIGGRGDTSFADHSYEKAFRDYGIDLQARDTEQLARVIQSSPIKDALVAALDDWSQAGSSDGTDERKANDHSWHAQLFRILELADPNPWRNRLRSAIAGGDEATLLGLAGEKEALEQPPTTVTLLARALVRRKQLPAAIEFLRQAQWKRPNDFWTNIELATCLRTMRPPATQDAIGFRRVAVALRPDSALAYNHLGVALSADGQNAEAVKAYRQAIFLNPADILARANVISLLIDDKRAEAEIEFTELMQLKPRNHREFNSVGKVLLQFGKIAEAEAAFREAIRLAPEYSEAQILLGITLQVQKRYPEAEVVNRHATRLDPEAFVAHHGLSIVLLAQKKYAEAEAPLREAVRIEPKNAEALNTLAWFLATVPSDDLRDGNEALELAKRACELTDNKLPHLLDTLATAHAEARDFKSAIDWSTKALELAGSDAQRDEITKHLECFRAARPWREN
jgi:serine/threonine protein kinase/tetratricopeptide (TPR) repeat protein